MLRVFRAEEFNCLVLPAQKRGAATAKVGAELGPARQGVTV